MNKIWTRLLGLEFRSHNTIKPKAMKYVVKKNIVQLWLTLLDFILCKKQCKPIASAIKKYCKRQFKCQKS